MKSLWRLFWLVVVMLVILYGLSTTWGTLDIDLIPPSIEWTPK